MTIRQAKLPDETEAQEDFLNLHWSASAPQDGYRAKLLNTRTPIPHLLRLDREEGLVGMLQASLIDKGQTLFLDRIVVHSQYRRQGIATELLLEFTETLDNDNLFSGLMVGRNKLGAQKLYRDFGYVTAGPESILHTASHIHMERPCLLG